MHYNLIIFQFSLHVQKAPGQKPVHYQYLHKEQSDPRLALAAKLIELCGSEGTTVIDLTGELPIVVRQGAGDASAFSELG